MNYRKFVARVGFVGRRRRRRKRRRREVGWRLAQQMRSPGAVNTDRRACFFRSAAGRPVTSVAVVS